MPEGRKREALCPRLQHLWPPGEVMTKCRAACCLGHWAFADSEPSASEQKESFPAMFGQVSQDPLNSFTQKLS